MSKLLIIEDISNSARMIQKQFELINACFSKENSFWLCKNNNNISIKKINDLENQTENTIFSNEDLDDIKLSLKKFIKDYEKETILILIDFLLISKDVSSPTLLSYIEKGEFSGDLYKYIISLRNGLDSELKTENLFTLIYSRGETFLSILSEFLKHETDESDKYFFMESCEPEYITWAISRYDEIIGETDPSALQPGSIFPLDLPEEYIEFFKSITK